MPPIKHPITAWLKERSLKPIPPTERVAGAVGRAVHKRLEEINNIVRAAEAPDPPYEPERIKANRIAAMGKLAEAAERIKATKAKMDAEADAIIARLDGIDRKAPDVFGAAHAFVESQKVDLDTMESELRQLSNAPLGGSQE